MTQAIRLSPAEIVWLSAHQDALLFAPDPFYAPFEFLDTRDGMTKSLAHDYFLLVERKLGIRFKRSQAQSFDSILARARNHEVSVVNAATATPERSEYLLFTKPDIEVKNVIVTRKAERGIDGMEDLPGLRVSVVKGNAVSSFLTEQLPDCTYDSVDTDLQALLNVAYGISDAAVLDLATASYLTEKEGIPSIQIVGDVGYPVRLSIGSRKDWPELNAILTKAVDAITPAEHAAILRTWINLENVGGLSRRELLIAIVIIAVCMLSLLGLVFLWTHQLRLQIAARTAHLDKALAEKEALISELYHRTNNNMQVIISMIELGSLSLDDAGFRRYLKELQTRIHTMALVQQKLYETGDLSSLDLGQYILEIVQLLSQTNEIPPDRVHLAFDIQPVRILFDLAVPCGLVINELVTNALKYAFPDDRKGTIYIGVHTTGNSGVELEVTDDGIGLPPGLKIDSDGLTGLQLVVSMVRSQLGGSIEFRRDTGFGCVIRFSSVSYGARV
jgi:two-component sensor histidine kinase/ABC-type amino acid transport substrate-binding protein